MVNDKEGLLLGLYRECKKSKTLYSSPTTLKKVLSFGKRTVLLVEEVIEKTHVWRIFEDERELDRAEIIELFASTNLRRQMEKKSEPQ